MFWGGIQGTYQSGCEEAARGLLQCCSVRWTVSLMTLLHLLLLPLQQKNHSLADDEKVIGASTQFSQRLALMQWYGEELGMFINPGEN